MSIPSAARYLLILALAVFATLGPARPLCANSPAGATEPKWKEVRIASEGARPPYNYLDNNELAGFEIDLGKALCQRMNVTCHFIMQDWDAMVPGLLDHQYDAIMAAMEISDEAREKITFSEPYARMPSAFVTARKSQLKDFSPAGLAGKAIGVVAGGAHQAYVEDVYGKSDIHTFPTLEDAILDLAEGRVDVVMGDKDEVTDFLDKNKEGQCCRTVADVPRDPAYFGEGIGVGLRKEDKELKSMFNKALADIKADGTFTQIRAKYFKFEID
ncbi:transporter substrate-binding domain-containing protein [Methyloferula stellata]|uniref:transporter substrate-binding domain-containing protein n=1 Tax=Methyloferula stellata TaxID=876270 RepID=UPI00036EF2E3|nr:transporter substrate-binding domain-containing protein [Methyloferula stellata]